MEHVFWCCIQARELFLTTQPYNHMSTTKRTKAERLHDLAEQIEREYQQPIYNSDETNELSKMAARIMALAEQAEQSA